MQVEVVKSKIHCVKGIGADSKRLGEFTFNGAAARKGVVGGDVLILIAYTYMEMEETKLFNPALVFSNAEINLLT